jgi:hypothetical protein
MSSGPSNMANFTENSYNIAGKPFCVKPGSIYTNPRGDLGYFKKNCLDPYSAYAYWYRRFPDQTRYINCYNLPWVDPFFYNKYGYVLGSPKCVPVPNLHYNVVNNGFKFYDTKINPTSKNVTYV